MKTLNQLISEYTVLLQHGEIQTAYNGIIEFFSKLRTDFIKKYPLYDIGNIYQGYMDMTYFSLITKPLKEKGLKIAIVYLHEKGAFEVWLSARNRDISKKYESLNNIDISKNLNLFHDEDNQDAIIESTLIAAPNFEDQAILTNTIEQGVEKFVSVLSNLL